MGAGLCARETIAEPDRTARTEKIAAKNNLLRDMAKRIAHRVRAVRFRVARKVDCSGEISSKGLPRKSVKFKDASKEELPLDETSFEIVYKWLSIFLEKQDKVVLQADESPGWPRRSLEGSITG